MMADAYELLLKLGNYYSGVPPFLLGDLGGYSCSMADEINNQGNVDRNVVEYRAGCRVCEGRDQELENELEEFAELFIDIYISRQEEQPRT
jgi:hypothetical protein